MLKISRFLKIKNLVRQASVLLIALCASFFSYGEEKIQPIIVGDTDGENTFPLCGLVSYPGRTIGLGCANVEKIYIKIRLENGSASERKGIYQFVKGVLNGCAEKSQRTPVEIIFIEEPAVSEAYQWKYGEEFLPAYDSVIFDSKITLIPLSDKQVHLFVSTMAAGNKGSYFMNSDHVEFVDKNKWEAVVQEKLRKQLFRFVTESMFRDSCRRYTN